MSRAGLQPILEAIPAARQQDARHYGVHPYFTRRPANVVRAYIERYSEKGDMVLDGKFRGGSCYGRAKAR